MPAIIVLNNDVPFASDKIIRVYTKRYISFPHEMPGQVYTSRCCTLTGSTCLSRLSARSIEKLTIAIIEFSCWENRCSSWLLHSLSSPNSSSSRIVSSRGSLRNSETHCTCTNNILESLVRSHMHSCQDLFQNFALRLHIWAAMISPHDQDLQSRQMLKIYIF